MAKYLSRRARRRPVVVDTGATPLKSKFEYVPRAELAQLTVEPDKEDSLDRELAEIDAHHRQARAVSQDFYLG